jgi:hypothetical protein
MSKLGLFSLLLWGVLMGAHGLFVEATTGAYAFGQHASGLLGVMMAVSAATRLWGERSMRRAAEPARRAERHVA